MLLFVFVIWSLWDCSHVVVVVTFKVDLSSALRLPGSSFSNPFSYIYTQLHALWIYHEHLIYQPALDCVCSRYLRQPGSTVPLSICLQITTSIRRFVNQAEQLHTLWESIKGGNETQSEAFVWNRADVLLSCLVSLYFLMQNMQCHLFSFFMNKNKYLSFLFFWFEIRAGHVFTTFTQAAF